MKTIFELSIPGRRGVRMPKCDVRDFALPSGLIRKNLDLPELSELDVVRHYTRLSQLNYSVDSGFYPLGSCTMKYNPKICEKIAKMSGFSMLHPRQLSINSQGALAIIYEMQEMLCHIAGMPWCSLTPAAGAQAEFCGIKMIAKCHAVHGQFQRKIMLIPDSAHGTNPASAVMCGFECRSVKTTARGNIDLDDLRIHCNDSLAGIMITNPNTLGLFDESILEVTRLVHEAGGYVYGDGANMNALLGIVRPGDLGFDVLHYNLHKTFATPHGGGGPGAGAVCCSNELSTYLPGPIVTMMDVNKMDRSLLEMTEKGDIPFFILTMPPESIGLVRTYAGHFSVILKAYVYCLMLGEEGLRDVAKHAILNANYLMEALKKIYPLPYDRVCMHEFVLDAKWDDAPGVRALDVAKRLMDYGIHPPTNYFPLIVHEALMIEPTETESKQTLDEFIAAMTAIAKEAHETPELLHQAPLTTPFGRMDEVKAAKDLKVIA